MTGAYPAAPYAPPPRCLAGGSLRARAAPRSTRIASPGRSTATGEPYDPGAFTAAHRTLPFGAVVDVARADGRHVRVRINDRGPHARGRIIDLSRRAAAELGMVRDGIAEVVLRVLWLPPAATRL